MQRRVLAALAIVIMIIVVLVIMIIVVLGVGALMLWNADGANELDGQMKDEADRVLALAADGRYADVVDVFASSCPESTPQTVESLEFFFYGEPFEYRPTMARRSHTLGSAHYALEGPSYAHIVVVRFDRDAEDAPWRPCSIAVAGYT